MKTKKLQVGFDIGGTNLKAGIVDHTLSILAQRSIPFRAELGYQYTVDQMADLMRDMLQELGIDHQAVASIGVAVPGDIDPTGELVIHAHNLDFHSVPLRHAVSQKYPDIPVYLANDANAAALAELHGGALAGCRTGILLTLGTGVGGGLILDGHMFNGGQNHGVELGHMTLDRKGDLCTCGNRGCVETLCNAPWLIRQGQEAILHHPDCLIAVRSSGDPEAVTAKLVLDCAKEGDAQAFAIFEEYVDSLSSAIITCSNLLDPEVFAIGGGVSLAGEFLFAPLRRKVQEKSFFKHAYQILPTRMGNDAGIIGAALLAQNSTAS